MRFVETGLSGVLLVEPELRRDERGFFARTFCAREFEERGLDPAVAQMSISWNRSAYTLRGLHWQAPPHEEAKLVRCTRGRIFDVAVDVRPRSPTYGRWTAVELDADDRRALYIPQGFAHGFMTLVEDSEVLYGISRPYAPDAGRGCLWSDPALGIEWPAEPRVISERDRNLPSLREAAILPAESAR